MRQLRDTANPGYMDAPAIRVEDMDLPVIRVENWGEDPPLAVKYICGENELDFMAVYAKIKRLLHHPGRGRLELHKEAGKRRLHLKECDEKFLEAFWDCVANLLDYFADFVITDTVLMQSIWYHMLDVLQEAAALPHNFWHPRMPRCSHSEQFTRSYEQTLDVISNLITGQNLKPFDALVHPNTSHTSSESSYAGAFKSGLKPWQQFLYGGSPGFEIPAAGRIYPPNTRTSSETAATDRFVPAGALAIIQKHTERARSLVAKYSEEANDRSKAEMLAEFDQMSLKFGAPFTHTTIDGQDRVVHPMHPHGLAMHAPRKLTGLADSAMTHPHPDLNLLDECIGNLRGEQAFAHPGGNGNFHMWHVSSTDSSGTASQRPEIDRQKYSEMFDEWSLSSD